MLTALEEARAILNGEITDETRELAEEVERIRKEGKEPEYSDFTWATFLAFSKKEEE